MPSKLNPVMDILFIQRLLLSVVVAGVWITLATIISEKMGSKLGGMIGNLPSTIFTSLLFIGITQGVDFAAATTVTVPLGMFLSTMFLFVFISLVSKGLIAAVTAGLLTWIALAMMFSFFKDYGVITWSVLYFVGAVGTYLFAEKVQKIHSSGKVKKSYSIGQIIFRALFAGSIVGLSVLVAQVSSPFWAGLFASFPAMMLSAMVILTLSAGYPFARATGKVMLLASTNIVIYSYVAGALFPIIGLWWGTLTAYAVAAAWVFFLKPLFDKGL